MRKIWTKEEIEILKTNYPKLGGECCTLLPNWSKKSIVSKAGKLGLIKDCHKYWTKEENELLKKVWTTGTKDELQKAFPNRTWESLNQHAADLKLKAYNRRMKGDLRKIDLENLTPEVCYWWGYIMSDGHLGKRNELQITCEISDKDHLSKFAELINGHVRIGHQINWSGQYKEMAIVKVADQNLIPKWRTILKMESTKKTYFPPDLSIFMTKENLIYFLIGFIDGDGCVQCKNHRISCSIVVHENWLNVFEIIKEKFDEFYGHTLFVKHKFNKDRNSYFAQLSFYKKDLFKFFCQYLSNCSYLFRKWNKIREYLHE